MVIAVGLAEGGEQADLLLIRLRATWKLRLQVRSFECPIVKISCLGRFGILACH